MSPWISGAAGAMISNATDLDRIFRALVGFSSSPISYPHGRRWEAACSAELVSVLGRSSRRARLSVPAAGAPIFISAHGASAILASSNYWKYVYRPADKTPMLNLATILTGRGAT
jgi:hypothetical protein